MRYILTVEVDDKCKDAVDELVKKLHNVAYSLDQETEYDCDICEDTGETTVMERVYANEPHEAPIGTQTCICRLHEDDGDDQE